VAVGKKNILTLCDEIFLKLEQEFKVEKVIGCQSLLAHNSLHRLHVFADSIASILYNSAATDTHKSLSLISQIALTIITSAKEVT